MNDVKMQRDDRDEWPSDVSVGTFDIEMGAPANYEATAHIMFVCPNKQRCSVLLGPKFVGRKSPNDLCVWGWNGSLTEPTLTPSVNCISEKDGKPTGGCGWHGYITNGVMK